MFITVFCCVLLAVFLLNQMFKLMGFSIESTPKFKYTGVNKKATWYNWIAPLAKVVGSEYGIPWQFICAQTALETGWGESTLLSKYNNFGGIKDTDGINSTKPMPTKEFINGKWGTINDGFEIYITPYAGLIGYCKFFHQNKRYATALKYPNDPYQFATEIKKAGYATDPDYVAKIHTMLKNDLKA